MRFKKKYYTSQVDERDCGCAALSMVLKTYGTEQSLASIRLLAGTTIEGTSALGIKKAAEHLKFSVQAFRADPTLFDTKKLPYPFIVHVVKEKKYPHYYVVKSSNKNISLLQIQIPRLKFGK
ncbi:hypothetical protein LGFR6_23240 [Lactococcus garvieae]